MSKNEQHEHRVMELTEEEIKKNVERAKKREKIIANFVPPVKPPVDELAIFRTGPKSKEVK